MAQVTKSSLTGVFSKRNFFVVSLNSGSVTGTAKSSSDTVANTQQLPVNPLRFEMCKIAPSGSASG
jgi:hypothetical protein